MSDIDPNHPSIRLRVLAKTLERLMPHLYPVALVSSTHGVTTTTGEVAKVLAEMEEIADRIQDIR